MNEIPCAEPECFRTGEHTTHARRNSRTVSLLPISTWTTTEKGSSR